MHSVNFGKLRYQKKTKLEVGYGNLRVDDACRTLHMKNVSHCSNINSPALTELVSNTKKYVWKMVTQYLPVQKIS